MDHFGEDGRLTAGVGQSKLKLFYEHLLVDQIVLHKNWRPGERYVEKRDDACHIRVWVARFAILAIPIRGGILAALPGFEITDLALRIL